MNHPNERSISMACTHEELCKFEKATDARFKDFWDQLDVVVDNAITVAEASKEDQELKRRLARLPALDDPNVDLC